MTRGIQTLPVPYCPICGATMVLRRPKAHQDWKPFWGCQLFPGCKGTRQIGEDGKPEDDDAYFDYGSWGRAAIDAGDIPG